jgi:hypothetical protein
MASQDIAPRETIDDYGDSLAGAAGYPADVEYTPGETFVSDRFGTSDLEQDAERFFEDNPGQLQSLLAKGKLRIARATAYGRTVLVGHPRALGIGLVALGVAGAAGVTLLKRRVSLKDVLHPGSGDSS